MSATARIDRLEWGEPVELALGYSAAGERVDVIYETGRVEDEPRVLHYRVLIDGEARIDKIVQPGALHGRL